MDDYLTEQAIRDEAEFQQLLKALSKIDSLRPTWTATSEVKVQKYEDKSHDGIVCSLTFTANDGVTVYLFNQPCPPLVWFGFTKARRLFTKPI